MQRDKFLKEETITILIVFLVVLIILATYGFRKSYVNRKRFLRLLEDQKNKEHNLLEFVDINTNISKKQRYRYPKRCCRNGIKKAS